LNDQLFKEAGEDDAYFLHLCGRGEFRHLWLQYGVPYLTLIIF